ncbi:ribonuclease G [Peptostreptococcus faecalis]|uniref:ribonuclease G n=1 Tax=Peptostreptococcus faecalis TaxID=2045015 RepID=UPI000C7CEB4E|nr:ribonuclease G [Peptostreptococcus faecalis]
MDNSVNTVELENELDKWSWGAFTLSFYWGIGNKAYLALLTLIPVFNLIWMFVCGIKGRKWAWNNYKEGNLETFLEIQKTWDRAGLVTLFIYLAIILIYLALIFLGLATFFLNF